MACVYVVLLRTAHVCNVFHTIRYAGCAQAHFQLFFLIYNTYTRSIA